MNLFLNRNRNRFIHHAVLIKIDYDYD